MRKKRKISKKEEYQKILDKVKEKEVAIFEEENQENLKPKCDLKIHFIIKRNV